MSIKAPPSQTHCFRCGTCCEKGGPALHIDDLDLVLQQKIPAGAFYTIRCGELVRDNVNGGLFETPREIIKIKSAPHTSACTYYDSVQKDCRIYDRRPLECRAMQCWDTTAIKSIYAANRIGRSAVFGRVQWLMQLIDDHENRCAYDLLRDLIRKRENRAAGATEKLLEIIQYDNSLRAVFAEKTGMPPDADELVFGRPLAETVPKQFGIRLQRI